MVCSAIWTLATQLHDRVPHRVGPRSFDHHRRRQFGRQACHAATVIAHEVRVLVPIILWTGERVPIHAFRATDHRRDTRLSELYQVAVDRRGIPIRFAQLGQHLGVRERAGRVRENTQDRHTRGGDSESARSEERAGIVSWDAQPTVREEDDTDVILRAAIRNDVAHFGAPATVR